jgi:hypothetical protein
MKRKNREKHKTLKLAIEREEKKEALNSTFDWIHSHVVNHFTSKKKIFKKFFTKKKLVSPPFLEKLAAAIQIVISQENSIGMFKENSSSDITENSQYKSEFLELFLSRNIFSALTLFAVRNVFLL